MSGFVASTFTLIFLLLGCLLCSACAQAAGWVDGQVNVSLCNWIEPRVVIVGDTVYFDGGLLYWRRGMSDGSASISGDGPAGGSIMRTIDLSQSFDLAQNLSGVFGTITKAQGVGNSAPNYMDGALLANYHEFFLYGGLMAMSPFDEPFAQEILGYRVSQYGPAKESFTPGPVTVHLPDGVTRYVTYGAAASAPSENLAWYISGMTSPSRGPIYQQTLDVETTASEVSNSVIVLDMANQMREEWSNNTLPAGFVGRAYADAVWLPVGERGIVVVIGGSMYPENVSPAPNATGETQQDNLHDGANFTGTVEIYDVAADKWYRQETDNAPGARARACAVAAWADDLSSFNIYYYGGYSGVDGDEPFNNEVWVLSMPSFTWTQLPTTGGPSRGRAGHKCVQPFPSQMMVVGGEEAWSPGSEFRCVDGFVQILNLTDGVWMDSYNPVASGNYGVPDQVRKVVGGDPSGGATMTAPKGGWQTRELGAVFATPYPASRIQTFFPYEGSSASRPPVQGGTDEQAALPGWAAPVIGVLSGLSCIAVGVVAVVCLRRRRRRGRGRKQDRESEGGDSTEPRRSVLSWVKNHHGGSARGSVVDDVSPQMPEAKVATVEKTPTRTGDEVDGQEMDGTGLVELMDTSKPVELEDTALTPFEILAKYSHFTSGTIRTDTDASPSFLSPCPSSRRISSVSSHPATAKNPSTIDKRMTDPGTSKRYRVSIGEVSGLSEGGQGHSRQMSDGAVTVSSAGVDKDETRGVVRDALEMARDEGSDGKEGGNCHDAIGRPLSASMVPVAREVVIEENDGDGGETGGHASTST